MDSGYQLGLSTMLKTRSDWPKWFALLRYHCNVLGIWDQIDPDAPDAQNNDIPEYVPIYQTQDAIPTTWQLKAASDLHEYKMAAWERNTANLNKIFDWINRTVSLGFMERIHFKMFKQEKFTVQDIVRELKRAIAPVDLSADRATIAFLQTVASKSNPNWASSIHQEIIRDRHEGRQPITLDEVVRLHKVLMDERENAVRRGKAYFGPLPATPPPKKKRQRRKR
ncbi:hypothetical protein ACEQ8H_004612 [Pleosporales sp. CAS-2024a]